MPLVGVVIAPGFNQAVIVYAVEIDVSVRPARSCAAPERPRKFAREVASIEDVVAGILHIPGARMAQRVTLLRSRCSQTSSHPTLHSASTRASAHLPSLRRYRLSHQSPG